MVTTDSGLEYFDCKESDGSIVEPGQVVAVHYSTALSFTDIDNDQTLNSGEYTFKLGSGEVLEGIDEGVVGMKTGATRRMIIPPNLAFGWKGLLPHIPPNTTLFFEVYVIEAR